MKALVVDDNPTNIALMKPMLERFGYDVVTASDGAKGVAAFDSEQPDVVLMDLMMPEMDGYEATRRIKERDTERFVPVLCVTALSQADELVKCIDAGGDDFLVRPFDMEILRAKLLSLQRIQSVHVALKAHEAGLEAQYRRISHEMKIGQHVLTKIMRRGSVEDRFLNYWTLPVGVFSGDLLLSATTPSGSLHVMLGDITGHGLSAAIGAQPIADIFYTMTEKGFSIGDIAVEINRRFYATLHPEIFCAACLIELDEQRTTASIWNGAMPDVFVVDTKTGDLRRVASMHQALGVRNGDEFDRRTEIVSITEHDRIYFCSDGIIEAKNEIGNRLGMEHVAALVTAPALDGDVPETIRNEWSRFRGAVRQADDATFVEISCKKSATRSDDVARAQTKHAIKPAHWSAEVTMHADTLRVVNPVPVITNLIAQIQLPPGHRERIFTVISELLNNALDHGILELKSELKTAPDGFASYFKKRANALEHLERGWLRVKLEHVPAVDGGVLKICVEDSGTGFDLDAIKDNVNAAVASREYSGRGIALVHKLCERVCYARNGASVDADYRWYF